MLNETSTPRTTLLRPRDQVVIAVGVVLALVLSTGSWLLGGFDQVNLVSASKQSTTFVVHINTASWPEIAQLPGVGETLARRIVESRDADGSFRSAADLRRVRGIGKNTLANIKPYLAPLH